MRGGQENKGGWSSNEHEVNGLLPDLLEHLFIVVDDESMDAHRPSQSKQGENYLPLWMKLGELP